MYIGTNDEQGAEKEDGGSAAQARAPSQPQRLFWIMGGGGVGKSVLLAEQLRRLLQKGQVAGWHFCRYDQPLQSMPVALMCSLAAMFWVNVVIALRAAVGSAAAPRSRDPQYVPKR